MTLTKTDWLFGLIMTAMMLMVFVLGVEKAHAQNHDSYYESTEPAKGFKYIQPIDDMFRNAIKWDDTETANTISDWTQYIGTIAPIPFFFSGENGLKRAGGWALSQFTVSTLTHSVKTWSKRPRPNGKSTTSFFSGHTSAAFTSAGYLCANESRNACTMGVALAGLTGYLRMAANKHFFSDVIVGAAVGYGGGYIIPTLIIEI